MLSSPSFFLWLSVLSCICVSSVLSVPEDEYAGWFSRRDAKPDSVSSMESLPPLPGSISSGTKLQNCVFENVLSIEQEESLVLLNEILVVDGCLLDCGSKILHSTVREGSIVTVRNGGRVKNCKVALVKEKQLKEELSPVDGSGDINVDLENTDDDSNASGTVPPSVWGTYMATGWATYWARYTTYIPNAVAGFLCDQGDCVLDNSSCTAIEIADDDIPSSILIMRECVLVSSGATDVRIQGGLTENNGPVSMYGIAVDAVSDPDNDSSPDDENFDANARLFVDKAQIRNQLGDGIVIVGGANTVRITNTHIFNNERDGINIYGGHGLSFFAVIGGSIELNQMNGINLFQYELQQNSTQNVDGSSVSVDFPTSTQVFISDVFVKANANDGLKVERIDDIAIDGAIFEQNGFNGIDISSATAISLQGVVCKSNAQNGLSIEAESSIVGISNSVFLSNGKSGRMYNSNQLWKRAGVYIWLPKKVTITNSASNMNAMDGIIVYDVPDLNLDAVDTMKNGKNGVQIRETAAQTEYDYTANTDYLVGAYYYPWHGDDFHKGEGYLREKLNPPQSPALGEYDDSDPRVISKHLEWFRKSNIGLLVASWWGPGRKEDNNIRNVLMKHDYIGNLKIALHYETVGRIKGDDYDMSVPESDIQYMCDHYFDHPNYYKIDGRPVLVIYLSRNLEQLGTLEKAILTMKSTASECGHHLYLIGDSVFAKAPEVDDDTPFVSFKYLDAVTNYDVYASSGGTKQDSPYAGKKAVDAFYVEQEKWRKLALEAGCRYIPPVSPGYNDRGVRIEKDNQPLSRRLTESSDEGSLFKYQLEKALPLVDPEVDNLVLVNSFNEWHEDTQIEPIEIVSNLTDSINDEGNIATEPADLTLGLEYVGYGELYLDILRNATSRSLFEIKNLVQIHKPSYVDFTDVRSCKNKDTGVRFYITDNSSNDQPEFVFRPGDGVISCQNWSPDYKFLGGGNLNIQGSSDVRIMGDQCVNGIQGLKCDLADLLIACEKRLCRHRDIVTTSGKILDDHKIQ